MPKSIDPAAAIGSRRKNDKSEKASFDDYADLEFVAIKFEDTPEEIRRAYFEAWISVELAIALNQKDHLECRQVAEGLDSGGGEHDKPLIAKLGDNMQHDLKVLKKIVKIVERGELRLLAATARLVKDRGETA